MGQLTTLLQSSEPYQNYHPKVQEVFTRFATTFDDNPEQLSWDTIQLTATHQGTTHEQWRDFLSLPVVNNHLSQLMKFNAQVAFRKAHKALTNEAIQGNTSAAKQITDISEILQQDTTNRTVVLTYVPRPAPPTIKPLAEYTPTSLALTAVEENEEDISDEHEST